MAAFLVLAGLTGMVLAFYEDLEGWLNPRLYRVAVRDQPLSPLAVRALIESNDPRLQLDSVELAVEPGTAMRFWVQPRSHLLEQQSALDFDELFVDPYSGQVLGQRKWGEFQLDREHVLPFLYRLHYTLALPDPWGRWLLGAVALIWTLDCFVGFYLTLPPTRRAFVSRWNKAWRIKWRSSAWRIIFDVHRAVSLWTWSMLLVLAVSSVQFNLNREVFTPVLEAFLPLKDVKRSLRAHEPVSGEPTLTWEQALARGREVAAAQAARDGFSINRETRLWLDRAHNVYTYTVNSSLDVSNVGGGTMFHFSALDGSLLGFEHPYVASGNSVSEWLYALHMARVGGWPFRAFVCIMGLVVALLSITGVMMWLRKRPRPLPRAS